MVLNILILILILLLTIGAGWLLLKAIRARRTWVKVAGGLGAGILTLLLAGLTIAGTRGFVMVTFPGADDAPDLTVAGTPEQIARGEYLANISCIQCHGSYPDGFSNDPTHPLKGGVDLAAEEDFGFMGQIGASNLTQVADQSDGELFRAMRHGVGADGRLLLMMSLVPVGEMSDADIEALIAYMRTLEPVETDGPTGDDLSFTALLFIGGGLFPAPTPRPATITAPPAGPTAEYGKYVASYGDCRGCHGPDMTGSPASAFGPAVPNPRPLVSTLSSDEFVTMMRTGVRPGGSPFPDTMPWRMASVMTDEDLAAMYVYLTTEP